jgi:glycosyltransferase involved in cell wall biosynthesis/SAM-dependent methyltransferase
MRWPKISIVTPSYNQGKYIERTVRSVLLQRYPNLEYILLDGGSTDDTLAKLEPYKDQFSYLISEPDRGQADALAKGFARSSGDIMAYLNSDDLLAPDALHFVARFFQENPKIDWIYSHRCTIDDNDRVIWYWILPAHVNFLMRHWDYIPQETCFWRRSLFEKTGNIDRSYRFAMDYDLFVRFMNQGCGRRLNRFLGIFRDHGTSKTKQLLQTVGATEMLRVRRKFRIRAAITDGFFGLLLGNWVTYRGRYFAAAAHSLPGAFGGIGYDYNDVWGGLLRLVNRQTDSAQPKQMSDEEDFYTPLCPVTFGLADHLLFNIPSIRAGRSVVNEVYLNTKSRVAIISPTVQIGDGMKSFPLGNLAAADRSANGRNGNPPSTVRPSASTLLRTLGRLPLFAGRVTVDWSGQTADLILAVTRGIVSKEDGINFLEVGCSDLSRELLDGLKAQTKWNLFGLETSPDAVMEARAGGHRVFEAIEENASFPEIPKGVDLVYMGRGIQCFEDPRGYLRKMAVLLNPGGFLVLRTPNLDSAQRNLFGPAWAYWKPAEHRFIFSRKSLKLLLEHTGFSITRLTTVSPPESTATSINGLNDLARSDRTASLKMQNRIQAESIAKTNNLVWNNLGKGDLIVAVARRVF